MMRLKLESKGAGRPIILCLGCHADDIEIGCGGTLLQLGAQHPESIIHWVVLSGSDVRRGEAQEGAAAFSGGRLSQLVQKEFEDGFMPYSGADVKRVFENELKKLSPDVIFTHFRGDAHQDHRLISELTWNTFRDHLILEYEVPKYDGDLGQPTVFMPLSEEISRKKVQLIMEIFRSQRDKHWCTEQTFLALMRLRGMECRAADGYAEAFYCKKLVL